MNYFAYGSNMSLARIQARVPEVRKLGVYQLAEHDLRFHMSSHDGSGKCDAFYTGNPEDKVLGVVYEIDEQGKAILDDIEGLGDSYLDKEVELLSLSGDPVTARTYYANRINSRLKPYFWYRYHVLTGARESNMPKTYIHRIEQVNCIADPDRQREQEQRSIYQ